MDGIKKDLRRCIIGRRVRARVQSPLFAGSYPCHSMVSRVPCVPPLVILIAALSMAHCAPDDRAATVDATTKGATTDAATLSPAASNTTTSTTAPSPSPATNAATFDAVWTTVRDSHWDATLGGVDWNAVRTELLPKATAAESNEALRAVLTDALSRLQQSHFAIIPSEFANTGEIELQAPPTDGASTAQPAAVAKQPSPAVKEGQSGADIAFMPHEGAAGTWDAIVVAVEPGSPAERAGVTTGMRVTKIANGDIDTIAAVGDHLPPGDGLERYQRAQMAHIATTGDPGTTRSWQLETIDGSALTADVTYELDSRPHTKFGLLPALPTELTWRHLDETERQRWGAKDHEIGLIRFNIWLIPVARPFDIAMDTLRSADGIIIDLRGNPGGIGAMAMGIAGHFTPEARELGEMKTRDVTLQFKTNPRTVSSTGVAVTPYAGPVAILVDDSTASTSEIFAGGMQFLKRAKVFGARTAGAALPAITMTLPNGDVFLHAIADYRLPDGSALEATGVVPDNARPYTRADYAALGDPAMAEAVRWIASQRSNGH
jgi:carboxyl-terminal processing protease